MSVQCTDSTEVNNWAILSVYIISFLIGLPANILATYAFIRKISKSPTPTDVLLLNLTISDLLFLAFLPLKMYEAALGMRWYLSKFLCSIMSFVFFTTINTSSLLLMAISFDRYLGVVFPIIYRKYRKMVYPIIGSIFIWVVSGGHCSIVFIVIYRGDENSTEAMTTCYENFTESQKTVLLPVRLAIAVNLFLVPMLISMFCYYNCIWILYHRSYISKKMKKKAIGMAAGTFSIFLLVFLPYNLTHLLGYITHTSPSWRYYALLLTTCNTCLDPVIFYFYSTIYRNTAKLSFWSIFSLCCRRNRGSNPSTIMTVMRDTNR